MCEKYNLTREAQDKFALTSYERARKAIEDGLFADEYAPVEIQTRKASECVEQDEEPYKAPLEKMTKLKPAFDSGGSITAANASSLNDGAAALVLCNESYAAKHSLKPMARILAQASHAQEPEWFTTAPIEAAKKALMKADLKPNDIDYWEINEAFSVVTMAATRELELDTNAVNARGGAVALGHPIGCSGARILVTLLHTLQANKAHYGVASICIGGGEATAMVVENLLR